MPTQKRFPGSAVHELLHPAFAIPFTIHLQAGKTKLTTKKPPQTNKQQNKKASKQKKKGMRKTFLKPHFENII